MKIKMDVELGHLLTSGSIVVAAAGVILTSIAAANVARRAEADEVRTAAAESLAKLDQWRELALHLSVELQPATVEVARLMKSTGDREAARDHMWSAIAEAEADLNRTILTENLESSYARLFAYDPDVRPLMLGTTAALRKTQFALVQSVQHHTQCEIMERDHRDEPTSRLGNDLRRAIGGRAIAYSAEIDAEIINARAFLVKLIESDDRELLSRKAVDRNLTKPPQAKALKTPLVCFTDELA